MTREQKIEARLEKATKGPWHKAPGRNVRCGPNTDPWTLVAIVHFPDTASKIWIGTAGARAFGRGDDITDYHGPRDEDIENNRELIANAPDDLRYLLGRVEKLKRAIDIVLTSYPPQREAARKHLETALEREGGA